MEVTHKDDYATHALISNQTTHAFGIAQTPEFFQILSKSIYQEPILAVVRETICNAWDAHISVGKTNIPVEVKIEDGYLTITDYGPGIPDEDMPLRYCTYGLSTKTKIKKETGGFGLGCKAPFAYVDHFEVTSCNGGLKSVYDISRVSAANNGLPGLTKIVSVPNTGHGLTVKIAILEEDRRAFINFIEQVVKRGGILCRFNGNLLPTIKMGTNTGDWLVGNPGTLGIANNAAIREKIWIRLGAVMYPVKEHAELNPEYHWLKTTLLRDGYYSDGRRLVVQAEPDSITITPNREDISYQEHTMETIKKLLGDLKSKFEKRIPEIRQKHEDGVFNAIIKRKDFHRLFSQKCLQDSNNPQAFWTDLDALIRFIVFTEQFDSFAITEGEYYTKMFDIIRDHDTLVDKTRLKALRLAYASLDSRRWQLAKRTVTHGLNTYKGRGPISEWFNDHVRRPLASKILTLPGVTSISLKANYKASTRSYGTSFGLAPLHKAILTEITRALPYMYKRVLMYSSVAQFDRITRIPGGDDGLIHCLVSRKVAHHDAIRAAFVKLGYEVLDATLEPDWVRLPEVKEKPLIDPDAPKRVSLRGYRPLKSFGVLSVTYTDSEIEAIKNKMDRVKDPKFIAMLRKNRSRGAGWSIDDIDTRPSIDYVREFHLDDCGVCVHGSQYESAKDKGVPTVNSFLGARMLEHLSDPVFKSGLVFNVDRYILNNRLYGEDCSLRKLWTYVISDKKLKDHFQITTSSDSNFSIIKAMMDECSWYPYRYVGADASSKFREDYTKLLNTSLSPVFDRLNVLLQTEPVMGLINWNNAVKFQANPDMDKSVLDGINDVILKG